MERAVSPNQLVWSHPRVVVAEATIVPDTTTTAHKRGKEGDNDSN